MPKDAAPSDARTVARRLGISRSTLNTWLAAEEDRPVADRRFHFHTFHGRKRLWSEANYQALERAIEAESSEPGGLLAGWRKGSSSRATSAREAAAATAAMLAVLGFRHDKNSASAPENPAQDDDNVDEESRAMEPK